MSRFCLVSVQVFHWFRKLFAHVCFISISFMFRFGLISVSFLSHAGLVLVSIWSHVGVVLRAGVPS